MARQTSRSLGLAHGQSKDKQRSSLIAITFVNTARRHGFCLSFFLMVDSDLVIGALVQKQELLAACGQWLQGGRYRLKPIPLDQLQDCWEGLDGMLIEADALDAAGLERLRRQGMLLPAVVIGEVTGGVTYHEAEMHLQPDQLEQLHYNLDAAVSRFLLQRLQRERGLGYLLITHDVEVIRAMAHRVIVMKDGAILETGSVDAVLDACAPPTRRRFLYRTRIFTWPRTLASTSTP